jgi:polyisoprenoid-binding protein YceI
VSLSYAVDIRASQFTVQAFASGLISAVAHSPKIAIRDWTAEMTFDPGMLKDASLRVKIKAASLEVLDELRDDDRRELHRVMNQDVLETAKFPNINFQSLEVTGVRTKAEQFRVHILGDLTVHGVTNKQTIVAQVALGLDSLRAFGEFTLLQTDYEIRLRPSRAAR